ncbi:MAG: enoyl-CoA hydratase/isomerase family protein [Ignavibacteriales bacterium]
MTYETIIYEVEEPIGILTLNRPEAMNAVNLQLLTDSYNALCEMEADPAIKVIVIKGSENVFAAGADIKQFSTMNAFEAREFIQQVHKTIFKIEDNLKPVITAIRGVALGGGLEMCLASDIRVAADNATFGLPEINLGIYPGGGGTQRMPRLAGLGNAMEYVLTGDFFPATRAYEMGLLNYIVPAEEVVPTAMKLAKKISKKSVLAVRMAKSAVNRSMDTDIKTGSLLEQEGFSMLFASHDQQECMCAFVEKRKAVMNGKGK